MLPPEQLRVVRLLVESLDLARPICIHELEVALADLAGVERTAPEVPEAIRDYAMALWGRLVQFPQCPTKESAR